MNNHHNHFVAIVISILCVLAPSMAFASFDTNLRYGASGSAVISLQQFLIQQGLLSSDAVTGNFFSLTRAAVRRFQGQQGVSPVSGFFGPLTRARANVIASGDGSVSATSPTTSTSNIVALVTSLQAQIQQLEAQITASTGSSTTTTSLQAQIQQLEAQITASTGSTNTNTDSVCKINSGNNIECAAGYHAVSGGTDSNGCQLAQQCVTDNSASSTLNTTVTSVCAGGQLEVAGSCFSQTVPPINGLSLITSPTVFWSYLYTCVLSRSPSVADLQTSFQTSKAITLASGYQQFFGSNEYTSKNVSDQTYLTQIYQCVLFRAPDAAGFSYWYNSLQNGASRDSVLQNFLSGSEFQTNIYPSLNSATGFSSL